MPNPPTTIAIVGATGAQGGGLARAILDDAGSPFKARVVTRNPGADKARALAARGAEVVAADLDDVESVKRAFSGATAAFCVTNFWEHFSAEREKAQARNLADAARATGLDHVVWSTLEDTRKCIPLDDARMPTLQEKYKVPHFDAKGEADAYFAGLPVTFLVASFYWENLLTAMAPRRGPDGTRALVMPMGDKALAGIASEDIGRTAYGMFRKGTELVNQRIGVAGEHTTGAAMAAALGAAIGEEVRYVSPTADQFRGFGFPAAEELGNMFQFYHDCDREVNGLRDVSRTRSLNPGLLDFAGWLAANRSRIQLD